MAEIEVLKRVRLVERGSPHSLPLMESGKILPGVRIIIANPETKGPLGDSHLGENDDALYVVGALDEAMELRGMRYHPIDIETSVIRAHKSITECLLIQFSHPLPAVFTWTNLLVVVAELDGSEQEALDLVPLVTNVVLEEHYLIVSW
ncbi:hypothetical protein E2320_001580 [Naja naja]|nr:hypothetical protein E2320_001580 [Naja naja]